QADYDTANANLITAQAQAAQAVAQLDQATINAPFDGRIGLRQVSVGDYVTAGENIVNLQSLDPIVVNFSVPEIYLNQVHIGDMIRIHSDSFADQSFEGRIYAMDSLIDPTTRTLAARAKISNPEKKLLPGAFVEVSLFAGQKQTVAVVPQTA